MYENCVLKNNQKVLIETNNSIYAECRKYKISDSINAYRISELRLRLDEFKKYRSEDAELIGRLKADKSNLQKVINIQASTISELKTNLKDSVVFNSPDTSAIKSFNYVSKWIDVYGHINTCNDEIVINVHNREAITVVESVKYKRFLGFLWKTKKIKSKDVDVLSKNPNTEIINVDYINIEK